jgi:hypothetical protein
MMFPTHLRIDALFAGVALGYIVHYKEQRLRADVENTAREALSSGFGFPDGRSGNKPIVVFGRSSPKRRCLYLRSRLVHHPKTSARSARIDCRHSY